MAKLNSQFPIAAIPIPHARVSKLHTSAAYTQQIGASVNAYDNQQVGERNDSMRRQTRDTHDDVCVAGDAFGNVFVVRAESAADDEVAEGHGDGAVDEEGAAADFVDEEEHDGGEDDEEGVLDAGGDEVDVAFEVGHVENVDDIVCHH
jgi:hypothetical protein